MYRSSCAHQRRSNYASFTHQQVDIKIKYLMPIHMWVGFPA